MLNKLGIGIVGVVDYGTRLYNLGAGFAGMVGSISFGKDDSMYLGFTTERAYVVAVEGDLVISTETSDSGPKVDGVYGFDVDWSESAKACGCGVGTLFVTNPDAPKNISIFTVRMDATQSVSVKFDANTGANARAVLTDVTDIGKLDRSMARACRRRAGGGRLAAPGGFHPAGRERPLARLRPGPAAPEHPHLMGMRKSMSI